MFRFRNEYTTTVWAMVEWHHPNCPDGGDWEKAGWWKMEPGEEKVAYGGSVGGLQASWYYYAHAADGAEWSGPFTEIVPPRAFDWCANTSSTDSREVGMRELDTTADDYTLRFTP